MGLGCSLTNVHASNVTLELTPLELLQEHILRAGVLSSSTTTSVTESKQVDGDLVTSVIEFKTSEYSRDCPV